VFDLFGMFDVSESNCCALDTAQAKCGSSWKADFQPNEARTGRVYAFSGLDSLQTGKQAKI